jgi:rubrerythrin
MVSLIEKELLEILKGAIEEERKAQAKYSRAASLAPLEEEKTLYLQLFQEEVKHEKLLMKQFIAMKKRLGLKVVQGEIGHEEDLL